MELMVSKERKISCYPPPALKDKLEKYAENKGISKSEVVNEALRGLLCNPPKEMNIKR